MIKTKSIKVILIILFITIIMAYNVYAEGFEGMIGFGVGPLLNIPVGEWAESFSLGHGGNLLFYKAILFSNIIEFSTGIQVPTTDIENYTFIEIPFSIDFLFPISIENASTPYFGLGPSCSINISHLKDIETKTKFRAGYNLQSGYLFAPEHWQYTFIDIKIKYSQLFISGPDIRNVDLSLNIGLKL